MNAITEPTENTKANVIELLAHDPKEQDRSRYIIRELVAGKTDHEALECIRSLILAAGRTSGDTDAKPFVYYYINGLSLVASVSEGSWNTYKNPDDYKRNHDELLISNLRKLASLHRDILQPTGCDAVVAVQCGNILLEEIFKVMKTVSQWYQEMVDIFKQLYQVYDATGRLDDFTREVRNKLNNINPFLAYRLMRGLEELPGDNQSRITARNVLSRFFLSSFFWSKSFEENFAFLNVVHSVYNLDPISLKVVATYAKQIDLLSTQAKKLQVKIGEAGTPEREIAVRNVSIECCEDQSLNLEAEYIFPEGLGQTALIRDQLRGKCFSRLVALMNGWRKEVSFRGRVYCTFQDSSAFPDQDIKSHEVF